MLSSDAAVLFPGTEVEKVADTMIEAAQGQLWKVSDNCLLTTGGPLRFRYTRLNAPIIHRSDRCNLSLFQLGLRLLDYLLNEGCTIPVAFYVAIETLKSVR